VAVFQISILLQIFISLFVVAMFVDTPVIAEQALSMDPERCGIIAANVIRCPYKFN